MNKIAILYLCTGDYVFFWENFFKSFEENFLPNSEKHYFVWTDAENIYEEQHPRVHKIYKECLGFPNETLMRYHTFSTINDELKQFDYIFFMNSNLICEDIITEEEFLLPDTLTVVSHFGFLCCHPNRLPYERNSKSTAYIPYNTNGFYVLGGVNGGPTQLYLNLINQLKENIDIDLANNIVAAWHDESHLNKYILDKKINKKILVSPYALPEGKSHNGKIKILDKSKYINIHKIKNKGR